MFFVACSQVWSLANFMIGETERQLSNRSQIVDLWIVRSAPPWVHQKWGETSTHCLSSIPRWGPTYQVLPSLAKPCQQSLPNPFTQAKISHVEIKSPRLTHELQLGQLWTEYILRVSWTSVSQQTGKKRAAKCSKPLGQITYILSKTY